MDTDNINGDTPVPSSPSPASPYLDPCGDNTPSTTVTGNSGAVTLVTLACVACRAKHLKCDGLKPCSRCASHRVECTYTRSRRGYKGPRRNKSVVTNYAKSSHVRTEAAISPNITNGTVVSAYDSNDAHTVLAHPPSNVLGHEQNNSWSAQTLWSPRNDIKDRCFEAFFHYFHAAHPFVLPKPRLLTLLNGRPLPHLVAAIRFIGSFYIDPSKSDTFSQEASVLLSRAQLRDGFVVQAMLLMVIGYDACTNQDKALTMLREVQGLALEIGLHQRDFAVLHGGASPVLEESWRRTWWELYCVDGLIAAVHQKSSFAFYGVVTDVFLPCEEREFISGEIPPPKSMQDFDDDIFRADDGLFSSFTYRIAALRNLGPIFACQKCAFAEDPMIHKADANIVSWHLHLPASKKLFTDDAGYIDEMLFQARMIAEASTIALHRQHSQLDTSVVRSVDSCAPHQQVSGGEIYNLHAAKVIKAAEAISQLITLPVSLKTHTPFFTCAITLSSIVHVTRWASLLPLSQDEDLKRYMRLNMGALKTLSETWRNAQGTLPQVKGVAQAVFAARKVAAEEGFWSAFTDEEMLRSLGEDEVIIGSFRMEG